MAFAFAFSPALLLQGEWTKIATATVTAAIGCYALAGCVAGFLRTRNSRLESLLLLAAAVLLITPKLAASLVGLVLLALVLGGQLWRRRAAAEAEPATTARE